MIIILHISNMFNIFGLKAVFRAVPHVQRQPSIGFVRCQVYTDLVLRRDRQGIRQIAKRIQNEETWKVVYKQIEQVEGGGSGFLDVFGRSKIMEKSMWPTDV